MGRLITAGVVGEGFVGGLMGGLIFAEVIVYMIQKAKRAIDTEYQLD